MDVQQYAFPSYGFSGPKNSLSYIYIFILGVSKVQQNNKDIPAMNI